MSKKETYENPELALSATDEFYRNQEGFGYDLEKAKTWLKANVQIPTKGRVLDICCGDGIWSKALNELNPQLDMHGIDISSGGIEKARSLLENCREKFVVGDAEKDLPWPKSHFELIFARGPGIYNQHDMSRPASVQVIEYWHEHLTPTGIFCSIFASTPKLMGSYTPMDEVALPYNRAPRKSDTLDFTGGKYHHTKESFQAPFIAGKNIGIVSYNFVNNLHVLHSRLKLS